jgi:hypothetical protein
MQRLILLLSLSVSLVFAQGVTSLPHIAVGGGWKTIFTVVNLSDLPGQGELRFHAEDGTPLNLMLNSSAGQSAPSVTIAVPGHGIQVVEATIMPDTTTTGWAEFVVDTTTAPLSISSVFRRQLNQNMTFEASVPSGANAVKPLVIPFDNTAGFSTGLAVINPVALQSAAINVTIRDANGIVMLTDTLNMSPATHLSLVLATKYPATAGQMGSIELDPDLTGGGLNVIALRFNPTGAFTTVQPVSRQ